MRRKDDLLWKGIIEDVFDDLLRFIFPDADQLFDLQKGFEFLDKELQEIYPEPFKKSSTKFVDKLVKVYKPNGRQEWFLVHVEVQGRPDKDFSERMFRYFYRILDRYQVPVTAIAIFTGFKQLLIPNHYHYNFLGTEIIFYYNTYSIAQQSDEELLTIDNPFALVVLAAKNALLRGMVPEQELLRQKLLLAKILLDRKKYPRKKIESILRFMQNLVLFEKIETNIIFNTQLEQIINKNSNMRGVVERLNDLERTEAVEKRNRILVRNLLKQTEFSEEKIAELAEVTVEFVKKVKNRLKLK